MKTAAHPDATCTFSTVVSTLLPRAVHRCLVAGSILLALLGSSVSAAAEAGTLTGSVNNSATGNRLEGARIEVRALGVAALTDNTGHFVLPNLPAGAHDVVVSYMGLDPVQSQVVIAAGQRSVRDFDLTTAIYQLDAFKVLGEREGGAAAITAERNAANVKNVVAMDQFGNLPNLNAAEVAARLPGLAAFLDEADTINGFIVRGMERGLNSVTMDGAMMTGQGAMDRFSIVNNITGTMFEQVELSKGHTPDQGADGLGGRVNFRSRSPLSMKEKRRINYSVSGRLAPSFTQQIPMREQHRFHPIFNLGYNQDVDEVGANARYTLPPPIAAYAKSGVHVRRQEAKQGRQNRRWNYIGTAALPADPSIVTFDRVKTGRGIPQWDAAQFMRGYEPIDPTLWREDVYYREENRFTTTRGVTETVSAGYAMAQGRVGRTSLLAGVRVEKTETESWGWVRNRFGSSAAERAADPVGAAQRDYANTRRDTRGSYTNAFPGAHLNREFTSNLRGRHPAGKSGCGFQPQISSRRTNRIRLPAGSWRYLKPVAASARQREAYLPTAMHHDAL